ncbi:MAG: hypothetical protein NTY53_11825 [Kiritimatiellaeota bacterium]|nr:hypothetical protein [Kiritimatiellota bacterium]
MKTMRWTVLAAALALSTQAGPFSSGGAAGADGQRGSFRQHMQEVMAMREAIRSFFGAKSAGNQEAALAAAKKSQGLWQSLPETWQKRIEERHAGTGDRVKNLHTEYALADDYTVTRSGPTTRDGNTVTREGTKTLPNGKTETVDATITKSGNTVTKDATYAGPNGKTADQDVT